MALIVNHQLEEVRRELLVNVLPFFGATDGMVQCQVDFIRLIDRVVAAPGHHGAKGLKIIGDRLIDEDIAVSQEEHALHCASLPQPPDKACIIPGLDRPSSQLYPEPCAAGRSMLLVAGTVLTTPLAERLC
jgi:hypothetical protein